MKIGIWLGSEIVSTVGGGASYASRFLKIVDDYTFSNTIEICYLSSLPQCNLKKEVINVSFFPKLIYRIASTSIFLKNKLTLIDRLLARMVGLKRILKGEKKVDIVFYFNQCDCVDSDFPFISNNWDIGHRSTHAFPELTVKFEWRDRFYFKILPKALLVICESETGKGELIKYTGLGEHKIKVMPMFSGSVSSMELPKETMSTILDGYGLKEYAYFYYPAQFWPHKNHIGLLKAFQEFKKNKNDIKLVLSGSNKGNMNYIENKVREYGLEQDVVFLGFVSEDAVYTLYKNAICLVMASHFGPTNMPPIEAMELGCPVICSDLGGHREIMGDNALYFNSFDHMSIYNALEEIICHREEWRKKVLHQKDITRFNSDNAMNCLNNILLEAINIRDNWG